MFCSNLPAHRTVRTVKEQQEINDKFLKEYKKFEEKKNLENLSPYVWNSDNTIESMKLSPCLANLQNSNRLTCYSRPIGLMPYDKYDANKFREIYYGDYYNPTNYILGNAQEMFWDFASVRNS